MRGRVWLNHERVRWGCRQGAMQCGREIVVSPLSLSRTPLGVEPTSTAHRSLPSRFEGTGLASYGGRARQYYQADHKAPIACRLKNTMDRDGIRQTHKRSRSVFTHQPDPRRRQDRLPGAAMLTGSPLPELLPRGLVEQGRPALETLRLPFATSVVGVWRSAFAFVLAGGFRFLFGRVSTKNKSGWLF